MTEHAPSEGLPFVKMHGLGNDFVIIDARKDGVRLDASRVRAIADRRRGVGCDQVIVLEPPIAPDADVFMRIFNADGSEVEACGNATRGVARLVMAERGASRVVIATVAGRLIADRPAPDHIVVDMGEARLGWRDIPLAEERDTLHVGIGDGTLADPVAVNVGNPHAVFFVADATAVPLDVVGPRLERHPMFPQRTNVEVVEAITPRRLRVRVWERGAGITPACGSGACAALVAAVRRGLAERRAEVVLDGGALSIEWRADGHVLMGGPVAVSFTGTIAPDVLGPAP